MDYDCALGCWGCAVFPQLRLVHETKQPRENNYFDARGSHHHSRLVPSLKQRPGGYPMGIPFAGLPYDGCIADADNRAILQVISASRGPLRLLKRC